MFDELVNVIQNFFFNILMTIDAIVYYLIDVCYQVFLALSHAQIFDQELFGAILRRIYILVGVLMMFFIVYSLLKVIVNPEELDKGDMAPRKIITNVITSLLMVVFLPTAFNILYQVQGVILDNDLVGKIVVGEGATESGDSIKKGGRNIATQVFRAFLYPNDEYEEEENSTDESTADNSSNNTTSTESTNSAGEITDEDGHTLDEAFQLIVDEELSFFHIAKFSTPAAEGKLRYVWIISTIAGGFCVYVLLCFVFDLGIRAVKLAALQIIAPLPIVMRILPKKNDIFNKWIKTTIAVFFEVFIRIFVVYLIAILAGTIPDVMDRISTGTTELTGPIKAFANALLIMGVIAFARQAPKMIGDIFGIKSGNMGLSLAKRMQEGGGFIAGAATGAAITTGMRSGYNAIQNGRSRVSSASGAWGKTRAGIGSVARGVGSVGAGALSAGLRAGYNARSAKTFSDMAQASSKGIATAISRRDERAAYADAHQAGTDKLSGAMKEHNIGTEGMRNAVAVGVGHLSDAKDSAVRFMTGQTSEALQKKRDIVSDIHSKGKAAKDEISADMEKGTNMAGYVYNDGTGYRTLQYYKDKFTNAEEAQKNFNETFGKTMTGTRLQNDIDAAEQKLQTFRSEKASKLGSFDIDNTAAAVKAMNPGMTDAEAMVQATNMKTNLENTYSDANEATLSQNIERAKAAYDSAKNAEYQRISNEANVAKRNFEDAKKAVTDSQLKFHMTGKKEYAVKFKDSELEYMPDGSGYVTNIEDLLDRDKQGERIGKVTEALDDRADLLKSNSSVLNSYLDNYIAEKEKEFKTAQPGFKSGIAKELAALHSAKEFLNEKKDDGLFDRLKAKKGNPNTGQVDNDLDENNNTKEMLTKDIDTGFEKLLDAMTATLRDIKKKEDSNKDKKK